MSSFCRTAVLEQLAVTVAHRDHEAGPQEDRDLCRLDDLVGFDVADRLEDGEHEVVVDLELVALVGRHGVLDGERGQGERRCELLELRCGRLLDPDPDEPVRAVGRSHGIAEVSHPGTRPPRC